MRRYWLHFGLFTVLLLASSGIFAAIKPIPHHKWVGTWGTARQLAEPNNMPPAPGLSNNTLRQVVCVSIGGKRLRLKLSNEFGNSPLTLKTVQIAVSKGNGIIDPSTLKILKFHNKTGVTLTAGTELFSDAILFDLKPRMQLAITIVFGDVPSSITGHPGSRTTSYLLAGQHRSSGTDFTDAVKADHWYVITGIDVDAPKSPGAVVVLGDSITDGRGSGTNQQDRWPDNLATNLLANNSTKQTGVLNMGIGGNAILKGGLGPTALNRFEHDVLKQSGVKWLIIFEGVNDLGGTPDSVAAVSVAQNIITAYTKMITDAHAKGIKVYGATITPFKKSNYYRPYRESARNTINDWIRTSGKFDAVIDFDKVLRDPNTTDTLLPEAQAGANDYLHPNQLGYKMMGDAVDLKLFGR
ncbi:SGNH/GDSL hydrolase family protein [Mucilaginibacter mali]|nr:SGNH/GDSL hydrolase family protein [Mucilaginibacter mali]